MVAPEPPEIRISWRTIAIRGERSILEVSWALRFILVCRGLTILVRPAVLAYIALRLWLA
jgi:hypothetical protein